MITPENFENTIHRAAWSQLKRCDRQTDRRTDGQTDGRTDGQTENTICRAAWSQLKTISSSSILRLALCIISNPSVISNWSCNPETLNSVKIDDVLSCVTLKFDG